MENTLIFFDISSNVDGSHINMHGSWMKMEMLNYHKDQLECGDKTGEKSDCDVLMNNCVRIQLV